MLLLGLFLWLTFTRYGAEEMYIYYPVVLTCLTAVVLFFPAPILFHRSRSWFLVSLVSPKFLNLLLKSLHHMADRYSFWHRLLALQTGRPEYPFDVQRLSSGLSLIQVLRHLDTWNAATIEPRTNHAIGHPILKKTG
jgi:hypothetical protein